MSAATKLTQPSPSNTLTATIPSATWDHIINNTKGLKERNLESRLQLFTFNTMETCKWEKLRELFVRLKHPSYIFGFFWKTIALVSDHNANAETLCQMMEDIVQLVGVRKSKPFWILSIALHHVRNTIRIFEHALPQCLKVMQTEPELCADIQRWVAREDAIPNTVTYFTSRKGHPEDKKVVVFTTFNCAKCTRSTQDMVLPRSFFNNIKPQKSTSVPKLENPNEKDQGCTTRQTKRRKHQEQCKPEPKESLGSRTTSSTTVQKSLTESPTPIHTVFNSLSMRVSPSLQPMNSKTCLVPPMAIEPPLLSVISSTQSTPKVCVAEIQTRKRKLDYIHVDTTCEDDNAGVVPFSQCPKPHNLPSPSRHNTALSTFIDGTKVWEVVNRGVVFGTTHETFFEFNTPESWSKVRPNEVFLCRSRVQSDTWVFRFFVFIRLEYGYKREPKFRVCMLNHAMSTYIWTGQHNQSLIQNIVKQKNQTVLPDGMTAPIMPISTYKALVSAMQTRGHDKENQSNSVKHNAVSMPLASTTRKNSSPTIPNDTETQIINIMLELRERPVIKKNTSAVNG